MIKRASIRTQLIFTYITGVILAVMLTQTSYHWLHSLVTDMHILVVDQAAQPVDLPSYLWFLGRVMAVAIGISLAFGYLMGRGITRRIEALAVGARRIAAGDLQTRIPVRETHRDELVELGATFNEMAARLEQALEQQKRLEQIRRDLVANVAHDLRTPLAAVRAAVEALEEGMVEDESTAARYLTAIGQETRYLGRLIDDLLALSQLEAGQFELKPETIYLEDIVQDCLAGLLPQLKREGVSLAVDLPATLPPAWTDRHATRRVLTNLLRNALAFTPAGGHIAIRGTQVAGSVQIEVRDTGPGIPSKDLEPGQDGYPRIFERFYRGDAARSGAGAGLGLAIARELVRAQEGRIWAESVVGEGSTIGFTLPRSDQV